jgi:outer membrane protein TolC
MGFPMRKMKILAVLVVLGSGCATAPPPAMPDLGPRREAPVAPLRQSPSAATGLISLDQALILAFERNVDLKAAVERIGAAEAHVTEALASFYPQLGARLSYGRTDNPAQAFGMIVSQRRFTTSTDVNDPGATQNWRPELVATYSIFRGFQDYYGAEAAQKGFELAALERSVIRNALGQAVSETYYIHLAARQLIAVSVASTKAVEGELTEARKRFDAGALLKSDLLSLEVRLAAAKDAEVRARNGVEQALASLRVLLALRTEETVELSSDVPKEDASLPPGREDALKRAADGRPELRTAARLVDLRRSELAAEQGAWYPRIDAFASYGQDAPDLEFSAHQDNWAFGVSLDLALFSGFRTRARVTSAERRLGEARALEEKARLEIEQEVRVAQLRRGEARERIQWTERAVTAAEEALRLVREQYQAGSATVTRYLEAEAALADARSRSISAWTDARRAEGALRKAIGGWK